ncbi:MAG: hypothetical protein JSS60_00730, partial [Verrucomicrobia bacterium]|nr:hypothetical protein [Verrucomicrobiota bacterium]
MLKIYSEPESVSDGLDEILVRAEEAKEVPPEPEGGIPRQWLPGLIRWPVRVLLLPTILIDLAAQRIARIIVRTPFKKEGKCLKRGNCCHYILVPEAKGFLGRL